MSGNSAFEKKTSQEEILDLLGKIVKENLSNRKILVTVNSLVSHFKIKLDKQISDITLRRYGVNPDGYFVKKYPEVFDYKTDSRSKRGLVINTEKFIEEFSDKFEEETIEKLNDGELFDE